MLDAVQHGGCVDDDDDDFRTITQDTAALGKPVAHADTVDEGGDSEGSHQSTNDDEEELLELRLRTNTTVSFSLRFEFPGSVLCFGSSNCSK